MRRCIGILAIAGIVALLAVPAAADGGAPVPPAKPLAKAAAFSEAVAAAGGANVTVNESDHPAASAGSVYLTLGNLSCGQSAGVGVQTHAVGVTVGSTIEDPKCETRQDALVLRTLGMHAVAQARLCMDDDMRLAYAMMEIHCPEVPYHLIARRTANPRDDPAE